MTTMGTSTRDPHRAAAAAYLAAQGASTYRTASQGPTTSSTTWASATTTNHRPSRRTTSARAWLITSASTHRTTARAASHGHARSAIVSASWTLGTWDAVKANPAGVACRWTLRSAVASLGSTRWTAEWKIASTCWGSMSWAGT